VSHFVAGKAIAQRTFEVLEQIAVQSEKEWAKREIPYHKRQDFRREVVMRWTLEEVKVILGQSRHPDWKEALTEQWGFLEPEKAVSHALNGTNGLEDVYEKASQELEGGANGLTVQAISLDLNSTLAGWSRKDPHAAWKAVSDPKGKIWDSKAFDGYGYLAPIVMFEHLSRKDAAFALNEYQRQEDDLFRGSMLKGMARGLPDGTDWKLLFETIIETPRSNHRDTVAVLRGGLLGRWIADDAGEAERWFRSKAGEVISKKTHEVTVTNGESDPFAGASQKVKSIEAVQVISLAGAVRHWLARDFEKALGWLKKRPKLMPEILKGENWLDPDNFGGSQLRKVLVECLSESERAELLGRILKDGGHGDDPIDQLVPGYEKEELRAEISELKVDHKLGERIFQKRWRKFLRTGKEE